MMPMQFDAFISYARADKTAAVHPFALTRVTAVSPKPLRAVTATANGVVTAGDDGTDRRRLFPVRRRKVCCWPG